MNEAEPQWPRLPGRFEVVAELGRGASGVVYRAIQSELGREVAIKVLAPGGQALRSTLVRFEREARVLARLRHPRVVPIHEVGRVPGGLYFSMGLFTGGSLADRLADGSKPLGAGVATRIARQICEALTHVHGLGVIHRDLKPSNVLLDDEGHACVADFGLALDPVDDSPATLTGRILGTPDYMAPEQLVGGRDAITPRTDVYALGALLYECLTGRRPFAGRSLADKVHAVVHENPPRPRSVNPRVPPPLERIVLKAMRKDPRERYASARDMARDLARFEAGRPVHAEPAARGRAVLPRPSARVLGAALVGALLAGAAMWFAGVFEPSPARRLEDARRLEASGELRAARWIYRDVLEGLRGEALTDAAAQELAVEGVASLLADFDHAQRAEREARLEQLVRDAAWITAELGLDDLRARLVRRALAHRGHGDIGSIDSDDHSWAYRTYYSFGSSDDEAEGFVRAMEDAEAYLFRRDHPLQAAACGLFDWSFDNVWRDLPDKGERPWHVVLPGLVEAYAREKEDGADGWTLLRHRGRGHEDFGQGRRSRPIEQDLLRVCRIPALDEAERATAAWLTAVLLDLPSPAVMGADRRPMLPDGAFERFTALLEGANEEPGEARWIAAGEHAAWTLDVIARGDGLGDRYDVFSWLQQRGFEGSTRRADNVARWREWSRAGAGAALAASLEFEDGTPEVWIDRLADEEDVARRFLVHERLSLASPAPREAPLWSRQGGATPVDLVERWREHFGLRAGGPFGLDIALLGWSTGADVPVLLTTARREFDANPEAAWTIDFELRAEARYERFPNLTDVRPIGVNLAPGAARLELQPRQFAAFGGYAIEPNFDLVARPAGALEEAEVLVQPEVPLPLDSAGVHVGVVNRGWRPGGGTAHLERIAVVARAWRAQEGWIPEPFEGLKSVVAELEHEFGRYSDALAPAGEHRAYWEGPDPMLLALFARSAAHRDVRRRLLAALETTTVGPFHDGHAALQVRALELALGGSERSVVDGQLDRSRYPEHSGGHFQTVGLATALLSAEEDPVRREAATLFHGQNLWGNEHEVVQAAWRSADEAMPGHLFRGPPPTDLERLRRRAGQVAPYLPAAFLLTVLICAAAGRMSPLATALFTAFFGYGCFWILDKVRDLPSMEMLFVAIAGALAAVDAGRRRRSLLRALPFVLALVAYLFTRGSAHVEAWLALAHGAIVVGAWCAAVAPRSRVSRSLLIVAAVLVSLAFLPVLSARLLLWSEAVGIASHLPFTPDVTSRWSLASLGLVVAFFGLLTNDRPRSELAHRTELARNSG